MNRFVIAALLFLIAASPLAAVDLRPVPGDRIAVLAVPRDADRPIRDDLSELIARVTARRLEKEGFVTVVLPRTVDELVEDGLRETVNAAWIVEIAWSDGHARTWGAGGAGGEVGGGVVGGDVAIVTAWLRADVNFIDGRSLEMVDRFELDSRATTPTLQGLGVGGRWSWLWVALPWGQRLPYSRAAGALALQIQERIAPPRGVRTADVR
jgi:hypothetical protein